MRKIMFFVLSGLLSGYVNAWEAKVVDILQHGDNVAVTLSPAPGKGNCDVGSPYILIVDNTPAVQQRFSMILTALASGKKSEVMPMNVQQPFGDRQDLLCAVWL